MKKVKLILTASMFALMGMSALTMTSCGKDDKVCDAGYEGKDCDVQIRTPMLGTYNATDVATVGGATYTYNPAITTNATVTVVNISKFGDFFTGAELVTSNVSKSGDIISFNIPTQKPDGAYTVQGSGAFNISTKKITIEYSLTDGGGQIDNYTGNWTMQP